MTGPAIASQIWNLDLSPSNEPWLPIKMEIANNDLDIEESFDGNGWGVPPKVSGEM